MAALALIVPDRSQFPRIAYKTLTLVFLSTWSIHCEWVTDSMAIMGPHLMFK